MEKGEGKDKVWLCWKINHRAWVRNIVRASNYKFFHLLNRRLLGT
jgi:hypothetical protein